MAVENSTLNIFLKIGAWVDKKFPDKLTETQVKDMIYGKFRDADERLQAIEKKTKDIENMLSKITSEIETLKTNSVIKSRIAGSTPSTMTPFATRQPTSGYIQELR